VHSSHCLTKVPRSPVSCDEVLDVQVRVFDDGAMGTIGRVTFGGAVPSPFTAHPKIHPITGADVSEKSFVSHVQCGSLVEVPISNTCSVLLSLRTVHTLVPQVLSTSHARH
jgi:hypothetical protein